MHVKEVIFYAMVNLKLFSTNNLQIMVSFTDDSYVIQYQIWTFAWVFLSKYLIGTPT